MFGAAGTAGYRPTPELKREQFFRECCSVYSICHRRYSWGHRRALSWYSPGVFSEVLAVFFSAALLDIRDPVPDCHRHRLPITFTGERRSVSLADCGTDLSGGHLSCARRAGTGCEAAALSQKRSLADKLAAFDAGINQWSHAEHCDSRGAGICTGNPACAGPCCESADLRGSA